VVVCQENANACHDYAKTFHYPPVG
jgi:hypothetical protein